MNYIEQIQTALKNAGYYTGKIDGIAGKLTLKAVNDALAQQSDTEVPALPIGNYILSEKSLKNLEGVNKDLVRVVKRAIQISEVDFAVNEGLRTVARQRQLVAKGYSQTMKSNHLTGNAVDLVPVIDGKPDFKTWANFYKMTEAMQKAAEELNVTIRWGGCWQVINGKSGNPKQWVDDYGAARRKLGKKSFPDGPHFEIYP
ncbi:M15 family metallopeptidase [Psychrobacter sp. I-STPA6b]|uniref:M15 family metallopeptidase n=1 Tax=Psychrobacter sp. I-STPA6b TaxID=2585718 RepID=UPI002222C428|nr:M15 family metallopeptidase [Psychrobacter sp. I-STPA6b]